MKKIALVILSFLFLILMVILWNDSETDNSDLEKQLLEIEMLIPKRDIKDAAVSQAPVAWHLDHMLKTINRISENLTSSKPEFYNPDFSLQRVVVHTTGYIPRGAADSPNNVRPPKTILPDSLNIQLARAKESISAISKLEEDAYFEHPVFKNLNRDQTRRFLEVHTNHHLKIVGDILKP